jgi:ribose 5-phosphate isomerase B
MSNNIIHIASDHAGVELKAKVMEYLQGQGMELVNHGTDSLSSCDYPDYVHPLAQAVSSNLALRGILICGSGNGVCITANKYSNVRAALCWDVELAELARLHNDANVICIPARFVSEEKALKMVEVFLQTAFEGGRHLNRVEKITKGLHV